MFRSGELADVSVELERIGDLADGVGTALSRAFRGAVLDGKSLNSVLGEVARELCRYRAEGGVPAGGDAGVGGGREAVHGDQSGAGA